MLYPQLNESRALLDLSGIWQFALGDETFDEEKMVKPLAPAEQMAVPASYNDQKAQAEFRDHYGFAYYQTVFRIPNMLRSQRLVIRFGAVTHSAAVYLNGRLLCRHKGGFLPFEAEIGEWICDGDNLLSVAVDNRIDFSTLPVGNESARAMFGDSLPPFESVRQTVLKPQNYPNFDFFNYAGIHRPVKIYSTPQDYIEDLTVTSRLEGEKAYVRCQASVKGEGTVTVTILDADGRQAAKTEGMDTEIEILDAKLWEPGAAYLYTARVEFAGDVYSQSFGIRSVEVVGDQFLINGKPFYFKGFGKHEDSSVCGRGLNEPLNVKDIALMKWMGANSFRASHYPYSEEMLNLCDREGIVVIGETPAVGLNFPDSPKDWYCELCRTKEHHEQVIRDMIARDKNHPCIVIWSVANEPDTAARPQSAYDYFKPLYDLAHACDPQNRPVTVVVCNNDYVKDQVAPAMDVICMNRYYGWYIFGGNLEAAGSAMKSELEYWKEKKKPVILTEYGADSVAGLHNVVPGMFSEEYQTEYYQTINSVLDQYPFVVGEHTWNFADFATIQGLMRVDGNKKGLFTRERQPKMAAHYFKKRWKGIPDFGYK